MKYQASNPEHVAKQKEAVRLRNERQRSDLVTLIDRPEFRRYLWRHINETCQLMADPFNTNGSMQSYNAAIQSIGKKLWLEIEQIDPRIIPKMMLEYYEDREREKGEFT